MTGRNLSLEDAVTAAKAASGQRVARPSGAQAPTAMPFSRLPEFQEIARMREVGRLVGVDDPFFRLHAGQAGRTTCIKGQETLNFASYDYCGLNADPRVADAARQAIDLYGVSPSGSRLVAGSRPVHDALEIALAAHYGTEAALCFVSGHATNVSTIGHLMRDGDLILHDALCHNSIQMGMRLSGAARRAFPHNDLAVLEAILAEERGRYRNVLIVTEGLFSMDGDIPPLAGLVGLKRRFGAWLMVDEAHALGCVGGAGAGSFEQCGVAPAEVDIWMGTLSKTLAATGGYVAGCRELIDILRGHASGFVYSVALAPMLAAAALRALNILHDEVWRVERLQANAALFLDLAREAGLDTGHGGSFGIVPVMVGESLIAAKLSDLLLGSGVNVMPVMYPAVARQEARLRFFLTALHTDEDIRRGVAATAAALAELRADGFGSRIPPALLGL